MQQNLISISLIQAVKWWVFDLHETSLILAAYGYSDYQMWGRRRDAGCNVAAVTFLSSVHVHQLTRRRNASADVAAMQCLRSPDVCQSTVWDSPTLINFTVNVMLLGRAITNLHGRNLSLVLGGRGLLHVKWRRRRIRRKRVGWGRRES